MKIFKMLAFLVAMFLFSACPVLADEPTAIENSDMSVLFTEAESGDEDDEGTMTFFDKSGKEVAVIPFVHYSDSGDADFATMSPSGRYVAVFHGMECGRMWSVFDLQNKVQVEFPRDMSTISSKHFWLPDDRLIFNHAIGMSFARENYAQCVKGVSVAIAKMEREYFDYVAWTTPDCDFRLADLQGDKVIVNMTCQSHEQRSSNERVEPVKIERPLKQ